MFRFILGIVFGILALIFVFQNMNNISVTFLGWSITTYGAVNGPGDNKRAGGKIQIKKTFFKEN